MGCQVRDDKIEQWKTALNTKDRRQKTQGLMSAKVIITFLLVIWPCTLAVVLLYG